MVSRIFTVGFSVALALTLAVSGSAQAPPAPCNPCPPPPTAGPGPTFIVTGRGWGHGVGMSQYGALGFAQRGYTYDKILAHYYRGTELKQADVARVRVLLVENRRALTVASEQPFRVRDGDGETHRLQAGKHAFGPGLRLKVEPAATEASEPNGLPAPEKPKPTPLPGPLRFLAGEAPLELERPYRGQIEVSVVKGKLRAVNNVGLEAYLYGVVPDEMPHTWPAEALKAQAVAARSYALAHRRPGGPFELYDDVRSQVYNGIDAEEEPTNEAIDATAGKALFYDGKVANTFFFSTSGGRTASSADVWREEVPYLVSVPDPYDSLSPHHSWGPVVFKAAQVAKALKLPGKLTDIRVTVTPSARAGAIVAATTRGDVTVPAADARRALKLRSTWFRFGVLSLEAPTAPVTFGSSASLRGLARGLPSVVLEESQGGVVWRPVGPVKPAKDGTVLLEAKPKATMFYRLTAGLTSAGAVRVRVAANVRLFAPTEPNLLRGSARPIAAGATIDVQRQGGAEWTTVARATVTATGDFAARLSITPGTYRARFAPGRGVVPGTSAPVDVLE